MTRRAALVLAAALALLPACAPMRFMKPYKDPLSASEHAQLAAGYEQNGDLAAAEREYRAATKGNKKDLPSFIGLGNVAFTLGHGKDAELALLRAHHLDPANAAANNNLAMLWASQGRRLKDAEKLALKAADDPRFKPYALDTLATVYLKQGKLDEAWAAVKEARTAAPTNDPNFLAGLEKTAAGLK